MENNGYDVYNILVLSYNNEEFRQYEHQFLQKNRRSFEKRKLVPRLVRVNDHQKILGYRDLPMVQVGNWLSHPEAAEILAYAMNHNIKIIEGKID